MQYVSIQYSHISQNVIGHLGIMNYSDSGNEHIYIKMCQYKVQDHCSKT